MADDVAAVLDALEWPSAHVIGHSLGGMIAQLFALRHADRIRSLTSISGSSAAAVGRVRPTTILRLLSANPAETLGRPARGSEEAAQRLIRGHRIIGSAVYPPDEAWLRSIAEVRYNRASKPGARVRQEAAGWASGDLRPAITAIRAPTLVIHGEDDRFVRPEGGSATAAAIPNARLVSLVGMGPRSATRAVAHHRRARPNQCRSRHRVNALGGVTVKQATRRPAPCPTASAMSLPPNPPGRRATRRGWPRRCFRG